MSPTLKVVFFFSSRRRHTRSDRDWSSDVCSSDLVSVKPHPLFEREGDDLRVKVPTPLYTALLGGEVMVPTPKGSQLALKVPPETPNGQRIRLAGQGMPHLNGSGRGDLFAEVTVQLPKNLTSRE